MRRVQEAIVLSMTLSSFLLARAARAEEPTSATQPDSAAVTPVSTADLASSPGAAAPAVTLALDPENAKTPPPTNVNYVQYGVAFAAESILDAGPICDNVGVPCILGPGGGIVVRGGWRGTGPLYIGGAYELTKQDPNKLYRIALLQQARAEGRYYLMTARVTEPYASASLGVSGYGNEWAIDTWGPAASLGFGVEYQVTRNTVVGVAVNYRLLWFSRFDDTSGAARQAGFGQLLGLDLVLEHRDALITSGSAARQQGPL